MRKQRPPVSTTHITTDQRAVAEALQYGEYVDWSLYGIEGEENY